MDTQPLHRSTTEDSSGDLTRRRAIAGGIGLTALVLPGAAVAASVDPTATTEPLPTTTTEAPTTTVAPVGANAWTSRTSAADDEWRAVTYGNGLFVAVARLGTGGRVMTSPDGVNWTSRAAAADNGWRSVVYGDGLFVALADSGTGSTQSGNPLASCRTACSRRCASGPASATCPPNLKSAISRSQGKP